MHKGVTCASSQNPQNPFKEFFIIILVSLPKLSLKNSLFFWVLFLVAYFSQQKRITVHAFEWSEFCHERVSLSFICCEKVKTRRKSDYGDGRDAQVFQGFS